METVRALQRVAVANSAITDNGSEVIERGNSLYIQLKSANKSFGEALLVFGGSLDQTEECVIGKAKKSVRLAVPLGWTVQKRIKGQEVFMAFFGKGRFSASFSADFSNTRSKSTIL